MTTSDALLQGGPRDGTEFNAEGAGLIELEIDGMMHRYIPTMRREGDKTVFTYDGVVDPTGAQDGVESAKDRLASPTATEQEPTD
ncbi:hypothetical protein AB0J82_27335 [Asanoa sp. NPDC049518]|uniref:hypothetical protein n=1 Tax=unclassified Asanoa TaxID=2685164 RepID=UPI003444F332